MVSSYPETLAVVEYHLWDEYATLYGDARAEFYSVGDEGVPWFGYDGLFNAWPITTYVVKFAARQSIPTPVIMQAGFVPLGGDQYRVQIRTCLEESASPVTLRIYAVVVEDRYPPDPNYSRNSFRLATATTDIVLTPGQCQLELRDVPLDSAWDVSNLGAVVWAQQPLDHYPAEVYQAAKSLWPFRGLVIPGDLNCDGLLTFDDINPFVLALSDPVAYEAQYPHCHLANGDCDFDFDVDFDDINYFVALLSGS
jgi:hypothetical protein